MNCTNAGRVRAGPANKSLKHGLPGGIDPVLAERQVVLFGAALVAVAADPAAF
jgi:hypothetical protein